MWLNNRGQCDSENRNNEVTCQVCGKFEHSTLQCFHKFDHSYQGDQSQFATIASESIPQTSSTTQHYIH